MFTKQKNNLCLPNKKIIYVYQNVDTSEGFPGW